MEISEVIGYIFVSIVSIIGTIIVGLFTNLITPSADKNLKEMLEKQKTERAKRSIKTSRERIAQLYRLMVFAELHHNDLIGTIPFLFFLVLKPLRYFIYLLLSILVTFSGLVIINGSNTSVALVIVFLTLFVGVIASVQLYRNAKEIQGIVHDAILFPHRLEYVAQQIAELEVNIAKHTVTNKNVLPDEDTVRERLFNQITGYSNPTDDPNYSETISLKVADYIGEMINKGLIEEK